MIRNKSILIFTSLLLFGTMTLADTKFFYLEQEELVEGREVEREELKEGAEGKDWIKLLLSGGHEYFVAQFSYQFEQKNDFYLQEIIRRSSHLGHAKVPLFLEFCSLKIPFCYFLFSEP